MEAELVALARGGDLAAFDELVSTHQERVYALAFRMLGSSEDAADVQQETFIKAFQSVGKFRGDAAFSTWLHRITVNLCSSRKRYVLPLQLVAAGESLRTWSRAHDTAVCVEESVTAAAVRKVLAAMPPHYRTLVVLRDMEERSFEEIAALLGCSVESARMRLCKARKLLREKLRPYLAGDDE